MPASGSIQWNGKEMNALPRHQRAKAGFGYVPQGREIFPLLSVKENLMTGFAALPRDQRVIDDEIFSLFPVLNDMLGRRGRRSVRRSAAAVGDRSRAGDAAQAPHSR